MKNNTISFGMYDVYCIMPSGYKGIFQTPAMSEIDAMHLAEIRGYIPLDCAKSLEV